VSVVVWVPVDALKVGTMHAPGATDGPDWAWPAKNRPGVMIVNVTASNPLLSEQPGGAPVLMRTGVKVDVCRVTVAQPLDPFGMVALHSARLALADEQANAPVRVILKT
jgi:hypothetical protein